MAPFHEIGRTDDTVLVFKIGTKEQRQLSTNGVVSFQGGRNVRSIFVCPIDEIQVVSVQTISD